jgi:hypothetical protein
VIFRGVGLLAFVHFRDGIVSQDQIEKFKIPSPSAAADEGAATHEKAKPPAQCLHVEVISSRNVDPSTEHRERIAHPPALLIQPSLDQLPSGFIHHRNLLIARVKITAYNHHRSAPFFRALVVSATKSTRPEGADNVI